MVAFRSGLSHNEYGRIGGGDHIINYFKRCTFLTPTLSVIPIFASLYKSFTQKPKEPQVLTF